MFLLSHIVRNNIYQRKENTIYHHPAADLTCRSEVETPHPTSLSPWKPRIPHRAPAGPHCHGFPPLPSARRVVPSDLSAEFAALHSVHHVEDELHQRPDRVDVSGLQTAATRQVEAERQRRLHLGQLHRSLVVQLGGTEGHRQASATGQSGRDVGQLSDVGVNVGTWLFNWTQEHFKFRMDIRTVQGTSWNQHISAVIQSRNASPD